MLDKLKADFDGIIELVNKTPPPLQEIAFKMILEQWFSANTAPKSSAPAPPAPNPPDAPATLGAVPDAVKPFLTANAVTTVRVASRNFVTGCLITDVTDGVGLSAART